MLVAATRSDNPLGGTPLVYDDAQETFLLGREPMLPSKILDLENRRQLDWANPVAREWSLETAAMKLRKEQQAREAARAAEAVAAAAAAAAATAEAEARAHAEELRALAASGGTLVFEPPATRGQRPAGIRAKAATFALPTQIATLDGQGRVVFHEPAPDEGGAQGAADALAEGALAAAGAAPAAAPPNAPGTAAWTVSAPVTLSPTAAAAPAAPVIPADLHTSRKDRAGRAGRPSTGASARARACGSRSTRWRRSRPPRRCSSCSAAACRPYRRGGRLRAAALLLTSSHTPGWRVSDRT